MQKLFVLERRVAHLMQQEGQSAFNAYRRARKELFTLAGGTFGQSDAANIKLQGPVAAASIDVALLCPDVG